MKIGNVELKNNIFLAPMAGITDMAFRSICKEFGAGLTYTEMISAKGIFYNDEKTYKLIEKSPNEVPFAIQIFGSDSDVMGIASEKLSQYADIIDVNMGCPAPKVVKNEDGSKLMKNPELVGQILKNVVKHSCVPVTVKIRKGWDSNNVNAVEIAQIAEQSGVSALTIHGRTREEFYSGKVDLDIIKKVKESVSIPVIASGDVVDIESATRTFDYTNCDAIMIGRGSLGNPWIFKEIIEGKKIEKTKQMIKDMILRRI